MKTYLTHFGVSLMKSLIRITACVPIIATSYDMPGPVVIFAVGMLIAELLGILEELTEDTL